MSESSPEAAGLRARTVLTMPLEDEDETFIGIDHVYLAEGEAGTCDHCHQPAHDPGMVALIVNDESALLTAGQALIVANRLTRAANLIYESEEDAADIERDMARFAVVPGREGGPG